MSNMKLLLSSLILLFTMAANIYNCSSSKQSEDQPVKVGKAYFQRWTSGVENGSSGIDLFIAIKQQIPHDIKLDSIYFRNMKAKLEPTTSPELWVAHFIIDKPDNDLILSSDPKDEYKNALPKNVVRMPFPVNKDGCIVVYKENNETRTFVISEIEERESQMYPSSPKN